MSILASLKQTHSFLHYQRLCWSGIESVVPMKSVISPYSLQVFRQQALLPSKRAYILGLMSWAIVIIIITLFWKKVVSLKGPTVTLATSLYEVFPETSEKCGPGAAQEFAVRSWVEQFDEVVIMADTAEVCPYISGMTKTASNVVCSMHSCMHSGYKRPTVRCLIEEAMKLSSGQYILFSNSDLVYYGVKNALKSMSQANQPFLAVGQRYDIDFAHECMQTKSGILQSLEGVPGNVHDSYGIDYFIFSESYISIQAMPSFLIGLWKWDNWFVDTHIRSGFNVIDATRGIDAIHLQATEKSHRQRASSDFNKHLFMEFYNLTEPNHLLSDPFPIGLGCTSFAPRYLEGGKIIRRWCYFRPFVDSELPCD